MLEHLKTALQIVIAIMAICKAIGTKLKAIRKVKQTSTKASSRMPPQLLLASIGPAAIGLVACVWPLWSAATSALPVSASGAFKIALFMALAFANLVVILFVAGDWYSCGE